jgi:hypothetical protein
MGVFEEVFAKRDCAEGECARHVSAFDEVFVPRGRWRNKAKADTACQVPPSDMTDIDVSKFIDPALKADSVALPSPPASDVNLITGKSRIFVKNTFIERGISSEYDSLREFLLERKVQSCPAGLMKDRLIDIDEIIRMGADGECKTKDEVWTTASDYGEVEATLTVCEQPTFNTGSNYGDVDLPFADAQFMQRSLEEAFNTASNYGDFDAPIIHTENQENPTLLRAPGLIGVHCQDLEASMSQNFECATDRLRSLRMRGLATHRSLLSVNMSDMPDRSLDSLCGGYDAQPQFQTPVENQQHFQMESPLDQTPIGPLHFSMATPRAQVPLASMHSSLETPQEHAQIHPWYDQCCENMQLPQPPPPPEHPHFSSVQLPPPPPFDASPAPVLRLSEALPPPELGTPALPSIGSLPHHTKDCKPCTFFHTRGCENAKNCQFCHLCGPGEKKKRLRQQRLHKREVKSVALDNARVIFASYSAAETYAECDMIVE